MVQNRRNRRDPFHSGGAFTLVEVQVTIALLVLVIAAVFICQYSGLRLHNFIMPKLDTAGYSRKTVSQLVEEVRCAQSVEVGEGSLSTFVPAGPTSAQLGNALRIRLAANTNQFIYYFRDPADETLKRIPLGDTNPVTIARAVTNAVVFTLENFRAIPLSNSQNNFVVDVFLQMRQDSARENISDSYQIRTKITRRAL